MTARTPMIAGNWKMYKTVSESIRTAERLKELTHNVADVEIMVAPTFTSLLPVVQALKGSRVAVGAQNVHWEKDGAYTGEISTGMLVSAGCRYCIIGHSERREYFGESDETVNKKIAAVLEVGLVPVMCIGESEKQREADQTFSVLDKQLKTGLKGFFADALRSLVIAYEPIWAIGTGKTATSAQAQEVHRFLRSTLSELQGDALAQETRILYGGSVKPGNIAELMGMPDIDGALVGGASLDAETFSKIVHFQST
ncbi:MAG: triose-phosphate isomerase [Desulfobacterales bacterium]